MIGNPVVYDFHTCNATREINKDIVPLTYNNTFYTPHQEVSILCGSTNLTLEDYQSKGFDRGSVVHDLADIDIETIIEWGKELLELHV